MIEKRKNLSEERNALKLRKPGVYAVFTFIAVFLALFVGEMTARLIDSATKGKLTGSSNPPADCVDFQSPVSVLNLVEFIPDPVLIWRNRPDTVDRYGATLNRKGFRGADFAIPKPEGVYRIVCMGDSTVFGNALPDGRAFPAVFETILKKKHSTEKIEVINAGVPGYSSYQGLKLLENEVLAWEPDAVTISFEFDDHLWAGGPSDKDIPHGSYLSAKVQGVLGKSTLFLALRRALVGASSTRVVLDPDKPLRRVSISDFEKNLTAMIAATRKIGAEPYLMTQPVNQLLPLLLNPIRRVIKNSDGKMEVVFEMQRFVAGFDTLGKYYFEGDPKLLIEVIKERPDWPMPHYLLGAYYFKLGDKQNANREMVISHEMDLDRKIVDQYNEVVRLVATRENVRLIDLSREMNKIKNVPLFNDDVHFNYDGARKAAEIVAEFFTFD